MRKANVQMYGTLLKVQELILIAPRRAIFRMKLYLIASHLPRFVTKTAIFNFIQTIKPSGATTTM